MEDIIRTPLHRIEKPGAQSEAAAGSLLLIPRSQQGALKNAKRFSAPC